MDTITNIIYWIIFFQSITILNYIILKQYKLTKKIICEYSGYINSLIHAICTVIYAILTINSKFNELDKLDTTSNYMKYGIQFSIGYFIQDIINITLNYIDYLENKKILEFISYLIHHISISVGLYYVLKLNTYHLFTGLILLSEISTIILNIYNFSKFFSNYYKKNKIIDKQIYYNKLSKIFFIIFGFTFFLIRIIFINVVFLYYYNQIKMIAYNYIYLYIVITILNIVWFKKIYDRILNFKVT